MPFGAKVAEALVEAMRVREARIRPEEHVSCAALPRMVLGEPDQPLAEAAAAQVRAAHRAGAAPLSAARVIDGDAGADPAARILRDPERPALAGVGTSRLRRSIEILVRVDVAARILGKAQSEKAEQVLRILVPGETDR